jgi:predicted DNA-binding transcriptional regulator AlpA
MKKKIEMKYLTTTNVYQYLGISKGLLYKIMKNDPTFPKGLNITGSKKVYDKDDIDKWLRSKSAQITK